MRQSRFSSLMRPLLALLAMTVLFGTAEAGVMPAPTKRALRTTLKQLPGYKSATQRKIVFMYKENPKYWTAYATAYGQTVFGPPKIGISATTRMTLGWASVRYNPKTGKLYGKIKTRVNPMPL